jgi:hypothetical protein
VPNKLECYIARLERVARDKHSSLQSYKEKSIVNTDLGGIPSVFWYIPPFRVLIILEFSYWVSGGMSEIDFWVLLNVTVFLRNLVTVQSCPIPSKNPICLKTECIIGSERWSMVMNQISRSFSLNTNTNGSGQCSYVEMRSNDV